LACSTGKLKSAVKRVIPRPLRQMASEYLSQRWDAKTGKLPVGEVFSSIYREQKWGAKSGGDFFSGSGSHDPSLVSPYVNAVRAFLQSLPSPPSVADLGCGDFNVGSQLRPYCGRYIACDVVPALIERDKKMFAEAGVDFCCLNIIDEELPDADVVFLRQVLQHLSNAQIASVIPKLYRYKYLVLTEHIPPQPGFPPNRDKVTGGGVRLLQGSGVVLTAPPFSLKVKSDSVLCATNESVFRYPGLIRTSLYEI